MTSHITDRLVQDLTRLLASMPDPASTACTAALETALVSRFGARHAVTVASGTAALHAALNALGIGPGDEVLVPALSVIMSVAPVVHVGARPIFVDCNADGSDFDYDDLNAKITTATKAILPVHLWGRAGDLARLRRGHVLDIVEDACQAQGTQVDGKQVGTVGAVGCFSMKDGKVLWCGEGGYLLTDDDGIAARARAFRSHNQSPLPAGQAPTIAHNYRLAEPLALIACTNLRRFDHLLARRRHQAQKLRELLLGTAGLDPIDPPAGQRWNGYSFLATVSLPGPRAFCEHLATRGVPNSVGTFGLVPAGQRPELAKYAVPCRNAAAVIDRTLAVILTDHDDEQRIHHYAQTIIREARQWRHRT